MYMFSKPVLMSIVLIHIKNILDSKRLIRQLSHTVLSTFVFLHTSISCLAVVKTVNFTSTAFLFKVKILSIQTCAGLCLDCKLYYFRDVSITLSDKTVNSNTQLFNVCFSNVRFTINNKVYHNIAVIRFALFKMLSQYHKVTTRLTAMQCLLL